MSNDSGMKRAHVKELCGLLGLLMLTLTQHQEEGAPRLGRSRKAPTTSEKPSASAQRRRRS